MGRQLDVYTTPKGESQIWSQWDLNAGHKESEKKYRWLILSDALLLLLLLSVVAVVSR